MPSRSTRHAAEAYFVRWASWVLSGSTLTDGAPRWDDLLANLLAKEMRSESVVQLLIRRFQRPSLRASEAKGNQLGSELWP